MLNQFSIEFDLLTHTFIEDLLYVKFMLSDLNKKINKMLSVLLSCSWINGGRQAYKGLVMI